MPGSPHPPSIPRVTKSSGHARTKSLCEARDSTRERGTKILWPPASQTRRKTKSVYNAKHRLPSSSVHPLIFVHGALHPNKHPSIHPSIHPPPPRHKYRTKGSVNYINAAANYAPPYSRLIGPGWRLSRQFVHAKTGSRLRS